MTKLAIAEKSILFMNNLAGDDLWNMVIYWLQTGQTMSRPMSYSVSKTDARQTIILTAST